MQQGATSISQVVLETVAIGQNDEETSSQTSVQTRWVPVQSSSSLVESNYGRQIVISASSVSNTHITFYIPIEATTLISAKVIGIPSPAVAAAGPGRNIDLYTDYGAPGEPPTQHQQSDLITTYDFTGKGGIITEIVDIISILTSAEGGDIVGLEINHTIIGGAIEYMGVALVYEVEN